VDASVEGIQRTNERTVTTVTLDECCRRGHVLDATRDQVIEDYDVVALAKEQLSGRRSDEARATRDEYPHEMTPAAYAS
jgi:hypothetical protein